MEDVVMAELDGFSYKNGFYHDMDFDAYKAVGALNGSSLVHLRRSPMYFKWMRDHPQPSTPAMVLGTATHRMILEHDRVDDFVVWGEEVDQKVRRGKVWDQFQADHADKMIVTKGERDAMVGMSVGARRNAPIRKYADAKGKSEVSMFWVDKATGRRFKGRADKILDSGDAIFDLKTCRSCQRYKFGAQAYQLGYHIKMAIYWMGYKAITGKEPHMILGAIESTAPYESAVYRVTKDIILQGLEEMDTLLKTLAECEKDDRWPAAEEVETDLVLPTWATTEQDGDLEIEGLEF
jgi:exodeoxyribonuclease VIII